MLLPRPVQDDVSGIEAVTKSIFCENRFEPGTAVVRFAFERAVKHKFFALINYLYSNIHMCMRKHDSRGDY